MSAFTRLIDFVPSILFSELLLRQVCLRNANLCGFSDQVKAVKGDVIDVRDHAERRLVRSIFSLPSWLLLGRTKT